MKRYHICRAVPQTVWLVGVHFNFSSVPGPRNDQCPLGNLLAYALISKEFKIHFCKFPSFVQSMPLYIDMKMIRSLNWSDLVLCHRPLDLTKLLQCCVFWENIPLELDWFSVDSVQLTIFTRPHEPFNVSWLVFY